MRLMAGSIAALAACAAVAFGQAGWMGKAQSGLGQMLSGTLGGGEPTSAARVAQIAWQGPGGAVDQAVALSEQDWLKLSEEVAPVSYLEPPPAEPKTPESNDAQPL
jgi:hypothetical protein